MNNVNLLKSLLIVAGIAVLGLFFTVSPAYAADPPDGFDYCVRTDCTGYTSCYTGIQTAVDAASTGEAIYIYDGTYQTDPGDGGRVVDIDSKSLTIQGESRDGVIISGAGTPGIIIIIQNALSAEASLSNFTVDATNATNPFSPFVILAGVDDINLSNIKITNIATGRIGLLLQGCDDATVANVLIYNNTMTTSTGIEVGSGAENATISNSTVANLSTGYRTQGGGDNLDVSSTCNHCLHYGATPSGVNGIAFSASTDGTGDATVTVQNSIAIGADFGLLTGGDGSGTTTLTSNYNLVYNNTTNYFSVTAGTNDYCDLASDANCQATAFDPAFVDAATFDFTLKAYSGAIGTASDGEELGPNDFSGTRRTTIYVDDDAVAGDYAADDTSKDYADITSAIAAAISGDTVSVYAGTYTPSSTISMVDGVNLQKKAGEGTITIDSSSISSGAVISYSGVEDTTLSGFTIQDHHTTTATTWNSAVSTFDYNGAPYDSDLDGGCGDNPTVMFYNAAEDMFTPICSGTTALSGYYLSEGIAAEGWDIIVYYLDMGPVFYVTGFFPRGQYADPAALDDEVGAGTTKVFIHDAVTYDSGTETFTYTEGGTLVETANPGDTYSAETDPSVTSTTAYGDGSAAIELSSSSTGNTLSSLTLSNNGYGIKFSSGTLASPNVVQESTVTAISNTNSYVFVSDTASTVNSIQNTTFDSTKTNITNGTLNVYNDLTATVTSDFDSSAVEGATISYTNGASATGTFSSTTDSSGQSTKTSFLTSAITSSGTTSSTVTVTGANSRSNTGAVTVDDSTVTITLDYTPPSSTTISINSGAETATETAATLTLAATDATDMMISNSSAFTGASWETYATSKSWTLSEASDTATVYAKFRDTYANASSAINDTITLSLGKWGHNPPAPPLPPGIVTPPDDPGDDEPTDLGDDLDETPDVSPETEGDTETPEREVLPPDYNEEQTPPTNDSITEGNAKLVKTEETNTVYVVDLETNTKQVVFNENIFEERGYSWDDIEVVESADLQEYTPAKPVLYPDGSVLKFTDNKVYEINNDYELTWIPDEETFEESHEWSDIQVLADSMFSVFTVVE